MQPTLFASADACDWSIQFCGGREGGAVLFWVGGREGGGPDPVPAFLSRGTNGSAPKNSGGVHMRITNNRGAERRTPNAERPTPNSFRRNVICFYLVSFERLRQTFELIDRPQLSLQEVNLL